MNKEELIKKIRAIKKKEDITILAHNYQLPEIQDIADVLGDSLELAKLSKSIESKTIVFCGVRFMAETVKILSPEKRVLLPVDTAGCPLADTITVEQLTRIKAEYPEAKVVSYVNTSAKIKAESDVCCTSSNAVKVVKNIDAEQIIFVPDKNLGAWVEKQVPSKKIIIWQGYCYVHEQFTSKELETSKKNHPGAEVLVHPEAKPEIQDAADYVVSTSGMLNRAKESSAQEFIIGTEQEMLYRLQKQNPRKRFFSLGETRKCIDMKKTSLSELAESLVEKKYAIGLPADIIDKARFALEKMVKYI